MTGQKNRFKTTEKLWDLDDKQLKSPKHDAMVLWLMDIDHLYDDMSFFEEIPSSMPSHYGSDRELVDEKVLSEYPIMSSPTFIAGYADIAVLCKYRGLKPQIFLIEVKPLIDSFGAVLRQINSYKQFCTESNSYSGVKMYLFTLDSRFDAQFESQGIKVLHPPEDVSIDDMRKLYGL